MARFRLLSAHQLRNTESNSDVWLPGDKENDTIGDQAGTVVGTGTLYPVVSATLDMAPLDAEAEAMIDVEVERRRHNTEVSSNPGANWMANPVDQLAMVVPPPEPYAAPPRQTR